MSRPALKSCIRSPACPAAPPRRRRPWAVGHGLAGRRRGEDELHDLAHRPDGVDVRHATRTHWRLRRGSAATGSADAWLPNRHPERTGEGRDGQKRRRDEPYSPPPFRNGVLDRVRTRVKRALLPRAFPPMSSALVVAQGVVAPATFPRRALSTRASRARRSRSKSERRDARNLARRLGRARHRNRRHVRRARGRRAERRAGLLPERKTKRGAGRAPKASVHAVDRRRSSETLFFGDPY